ncbi:PAS domain S-box protein [Hymenobacter sp. M29]|uniref:PAS domain S-box protein n=1 Tax=Hymenobacter mellowenesis TaxID=3063995 RepID=A0ABT9A8D0_9BACT|nr:PAS domain S-box protein [Hymenobacter sp. M29]MDO7846104.1 PAS domain S-box protein [Hymenobacter sp. M29]
MAPSDSSAPDACQPASPHEALLALRARAEQRRHLVTQAGEQYAPSDVQRLLQELQVHQIELEMQYEELLVAQAEASTARAQYTDLYDFAPVGYCTLSAVGTIEQLNLCASRQLGSVRQRLVGRRFALFVAPPDRLDFGQFLTRVLSTDVTLSTQLTLQREDGTPFYAQLEGLRAAGPDGPQCRLALVDMTARRQASEALAASEARFRKLFSDSNDAVVLLQGHQFVDCNEAAVRLLGCRSKAEVVGQPAWAHAPDVQPGGQRTIDLFRETTTDALRNGSRRCEALMHKATGEQMWIEAVLTPIELGGNTPMVHILWRDITQARAAREELRQSQERLQMALAASDSGVWVWEIAGHELHWDARAQTIFGLPYRPGPVSFEALRGAVHPQDQPAVAEGLRRALAQQAPFDLEHRIVWPDGSVRFVATQGKAVADAAGQPLRLVGIVRDVTPRREAENALRREKEFTESLLENTVDGILAIDRAQRITAWNAEAARYFGQEAAAVLGRPLFEVMHFLDEQARTNVARALAGDHISRTHQPFHSRPGYFDVFLIPLKDDSQDLPSGVLVLIRDITERDRLAEEATQLRLRRQQEVLAAVLATQEAERKRIAEALHNGLGQVLYATKLSLEHPASAALAHREPLKLLEEAIRTTRTISFELTPGVLEDFGLRTALETLVKRMAPTGLPVGLHLRGLERRLPAPVEIAVYRVVQELLNNVMKHAHASETEVHVAREHGRLYVSVEDNGRGFDPASLTTQPLAGIGLSGVRNRVALLGGELGLASRLGRGTIVSFELNL